MEAVEEDAEKSHEKRDGVGDDDDDDDEDVDMDEGGVNKKPEEDEPIKVAINASLQLYLLLSSFLPGPPERSSLITPATFAAPTSTATVASRTNPLFFFSLFFCM